MKQTQWMLKPISVPDEDQFEQLTAIWNRAYPPDMRVSERLFRYNLARVPEVKREGRIAYLDGRMVGFIYASYMPDTPSVTPSHFGWVDVVAVLPEHQNMGVGADLLKWAEDWLRAEGCKVAYLGGGIPPFMPGLPVKTDQSELFLRNGWANQSPVPYTWDVARDLGVGSEDLDRKDPPQPGKLFRAAESDRAALIDFMHREFPGRWRYMVEAYLRLNGPISDIIIFKPEPDRVEGFCWITFESSARPLDCYFLASLPEPWGQLGPIGVAEAYKGQGWGGALLQFGLQTLFENGVRGCVIDWTMLLDFYGLYGFKPFHQYHILMKELE
ncbi:MAG: GNAT family N-acetyltransferase [Anaerolineaceae bacterium]|nr:GNAT family N-acetyltransferase [Anaerolineaceae bacterium]